MTVRSLGFRSDLMLLRLQGGVVTEHEGYLVVRTPSNPGFWWGNFLLLNHPPVPGSVGSWVHAFRSEFPSADHVAIGVDDTTGAAGVDEELQAAFLQVSRRCVMTANSVQPPSQPNTGADFRMLASDEDWFAALALRQANNTMHAHDAYTAFARRELEAMRELQRRGYGGWFGAFLDGRMVCGLGIFTDGSGMARFQSVDTHPAYRRRGLARTLVHAAGQYALESLGVRTLVMVADPGYGAINLYRSLGFATAETQVQLQRRGI